MKAFFSLFLQECAAINTSNITISGWSWDDTRHNVRQVFIFLMWKGGSLNWAASATTRVSVDANSEASCKQSNSKYNRVKDQCSTNMELSTITQIQLKQSIINMGPCVIGKLATNNDIWRIYCSVFVWKLSEKRCYIQPKWKFKWKVHKNAILRAKRNRFPRCDLLFKNEYFQKDAENVII